MELKEGYKQTEVGVIPREWEITKLRDQCVLITKGTTPTSIGKDFQRHGVNFIKIETLEKNGKINEDKLAFIDDETNNLLRRSQLCRYDIIFSIAGALGRIAFIDEYILPANTNQALSLIRLHPNSQLDHKYLVYFLGSHFIKKHIELINVQAAQANLSLENIRDLKIITPPLLEQRAIAAALNDVDALLTALDALIAKKRAIKQGVMQELLTGKTRLPGFSEEWEPKTIEEMFVFLNTANNSRSELSNSGKVGYIHYGDIHTRWKGFLDCSNAELPFIPEAKVKNVPFLEDGDLVMADASEDYEGVGVSIELRNVTGRKIVAGLHTLLLRGDKEIIADGFKGYLLFIPAFKNSLIRVATGISVYGISKNNIKSISILLPDIQEQKAIAAVLSDMDAEIDALVQQREKTRLVKQGMMQELLTGRIRLL
jgi:type I restriction enzyme, S subunit